MPESQALVSFGDKLNTVIRNIVQSTSSHTVVSSSAGSTGPLFISQLADLTDTPLLVVADSYASAKQLEQDFNFFIDAASVHLFPHWDTVPYDNQSPDKEVVANRFQTLYRVLSGEAKIVITTPNALMLRVMPPEVFVADCFDLLVDNAYPRDALLKRLISLGFVRVDMVEEKGEFSVRGEIIDIFPISEVEPVRLDFFDDELESIKFFDVETQRSIRQTQRVQILPAQDIVYDDETAQRAKERLLPLKKDSTPQVYQFVAEQIEAGCVFSGMESLLPLFYPSTSTLLDYYEQPPQILYIEKADVEENAHRFFDEILAEYEVSRQEGTPTLDPDIVYLPAEALIKTLSNLREIDIQQLNLDKGSTRFDLSTVNNDSLRSIAASADNMDKGLVHNVFLQLKEWHQAGVKIGISVNSVSRADRIRQMLEEIEMSVSVMDSPEPEILRDFFTKPFSEKENSFSIISRPISQGFRWIDQLGNTKLALISDEEIFGRRQKKQSIRGGGLKKFFSSLGDLNVGDLVVHIEYGIGKYEGLQKIAVGQHEADYLVIVYQDGDKVYVPVDKFHLVQKYSGGETAQARLNKLGGKTWVKTKAKIRSEIDDMAEDLVRINAERQARKGVAFSPDSTLMNEFTLSFPYQETEDQEKAIRDVLFDMEQEKPMDRLVCGDVGYGKTEVAMRAAYKAAIDGYQVAILVPTTILAQQHYDSFRNRFSETPVEIGMVSRFRTPRQTKDTLKKLKEGSLDILIGTHRILSKDIVFNKLGLLVIDEEQRFGVKHKESVKQIKTTVDTLTLSATPIPRTLHMSMVGIRDISVINTAPMDRRAIRTRLLKFNDYVIQEAINRETRRNGQIYFIHNRVDSILQVGQYLNRILPKVRVAIAHGQMAERQLEEIMMAFINGEYDVLLATTIVESGLDIPNVNTIIVNNADHFGLSQLYQLRGRVGRSNVQAYSYLMTAREKVLTETARKRLTILQELNHLGAGFKIANYDLELRGAGNVLGAQQSGHIAAVGFELYTAMVESAVNRLKGEEQSQAETSDIKLNLVAEANLPESYIDSMSQRLEAYKSISGCKTEDELWEVRGSLEDRFGKLPKEVVNLFYFMQIKQLAGEVYILELNQSYHTLEIAFSESFKPDPTEFMTYMKESEFKPKLLPNSVLTVSLKDENLETVLRFLQAFRKDMKLGGVDEATDE